MSTSGGSARRCRRPQDPEGADAASPSRPTIPAPPERSGYASTHEIVSQAAWVPVYNPRSMVMLSTRIGNYQFDPYWSVLIDQLWSGYLVARLPGNSP
jgi:hypothetical protein